MSTFNSSALVSPLQQDLQASILSIAKQSHLNVKVRVDQPQMSYFTMYEEQLVRFDIDDVAPDGILAPKKARFVIFFNRLVTTLQEIGQTLNFKVELASRDGSRRIYRLTDDPLTGVEVFAEYQKSLELQRQHQSSVILRLIAAHSDFLAPSAHAINKYKKSDFI